MIAAPCQPPRRGERNGAACSPALVALVAGALALGGCGARYPADPAPPATPRAVPVVAQCQDCHLDLACGAGGTCLREPDGSDFCALPCRDGGCDAPGTACIPLDPTDPRRTGCYPVGGSCATWPAPGSGSSGSSAGPTSTATSTSGSTSGCGSTGGSSGSSSSTSGSGSSTGGPCTPDTWSGWPQSFFDTQCNRCHGFTTQASVVRSRSQITADIQSGRMPRGATLSPADQARILTWLSCGAP